jgi:hypothetical protein
MIHHVSTLWKPQQKNAQIEQYFFEKKAHLIQKLFQLSVKAKAEDRGIQSISGSFSLFKLHSPALERKYCVALDV